MPDVVGSNGATFTVGALAPGDSATIVLTLLALASPSNLLGADHATVSATDENGDPAGPASANSSVLVTRPGVTVAKTRHAGQDPVVQVGQTVTYDLTVTNSGNTTLTTVPLADAFDAAALSFDSATVAPDSTTPARLALVDERRHAGAWRLDHDRRDVHRDRRAERAGHDRHRHRDRRDRPVRRRDAELDLECGRAHHPSCARNHQDPHERRLRDPGESGRHVHHRSHEHR